MKIFNFRVAIIMFPVSILYLNSVPVAAEYNVFIHNGVPYTDVIVNGNPQSLAKVEDFERRCQTEAVTGRWWMDRNGNIGPMGRSATYNVQSCQSLPLQAFPSGHLSQPQRTQSSQTGSCTSFSGGSICSWDE